MGNNNNNNNNNNLIEVPKLKVEDRKQLTKLDILRKLSSGTELRDGINDIVNGRMGALIVISNPKVFNIFQGGFRVDCKFTSKRLVELAKMDGGIILSENFKKILYANTLLVPDRGLSSFETGSRHQAAERTAKQTNGLIIAVSQRKGEITIFNGSSKYILQHTEALLRRATETLQILEKQRDVFNELLTNLNVLEITNLVSVGDVCKILQRINMIKKMAKIINENIIELGKDGIILRMRMREIIRGIEKEEFLIVQDYIQKPFRTIQFFESLNFDEILDLENIANNLFEESLDKEIFPKGYRILNKTGLGKIQIESLVKFFHNLNDIVNSNENELEEILREKTGIFKKEFNHLREQILVGRRV